MGKINNFGLEVIFCSNVYYSFQGIRCDLPYLVIDQAMYILVQTKMTTQVINGEISNLDIIRLSLKTMDETEEIGVSRYNDSFNG